MPAPSAASSDPDIEAPDGRLAESESLAIRESEIASEPTTEPPAEKQAVVADLEYWHAALVVVTPGSHADLFKAAATELFGPGQFVQGIWIWDVRRLSGPRGGL